MAMRIKRDANRRLGPLKRDEIMVRLAANPLEISILLPQPADGAAHGRRHILFAHVDREPILRDRLT